ncbi:MAG: IS66 family transposase, partial [Candidatus Sericytochromatia bacterium]|nr:IS66 family transposase [Candidatus Tanganyikabacteria bacterium]
MQDAPSLPQDLSGCHALLSEQSAALVELQAAREKLSQENAELNLTIEKLLAGHRRERFDDPAQLKLDLRGDEAAAEGAADAAADAEATIEYTVRRRVKKKKPRDEKLPEHLPRYEVEAPAAEADKQCAEHGPREIVGYDVTETLEFERPKLRVRVTKYPKFACPQHPECGLASPERPNSLVEGNRYDTSVAAEIIVAKNGFHMPIYRQQDWFGGCGWMPQRSTLLNILSSAAYTLEPLYLHYADFVRQSPVVSTDETGVKLLLPQHLPAAIPGDPKSQRIHQVLSEALAEHKPHIKARMWAYRSLDSHPANVFDFTVSRHRDGPRDFLAHYQGTLLGDCYSGFDSIVLDSASRMVRAACHAHARRYVYEARPYHPQEASVLLARYRELYDIEDQVRGQSPEEVLAMRRQRSAPIWAAMRAWLDGDAARRVLPKSRLGEAIRYLNNQWDALSVFLTDGRVPFDNNLTEQLMKQVATGRKNWLFVGSVEAGYRAAILLTIVSTAHRHHLDVWLYVRDVLDRLLSGERDLASLRADRWGLAHPEAVRQHRVE